MKVCDELKCWIQIWLSLNAEENAEGDKYLHTLELGHFILHTKAEI